MSPKRPPKVCAKPGCYNAANGTYCDDHKKASTRYDANRPKVAERGYGARWRHVREVKLGQDPFCEIREKCNGTAATEVDHIVPVNKGGDQWDIDNLQSACKPCHSWKTRTQDM